MSNNQPAIQHISDTARWAAVYRAAETERADALFRDPFARRLAGERGAQIAAALPFHDQNSWSWVMRTYLFDRFITEQIEGGVDMVVNLAAGLDMRPYRMALPERLTWVEVDLPGIIAYKEGLIEGEKPSCALERVRLDLADGDARRAFFNALGERAKKGLVLSEGLIIYVTADEAGDLAKDLFDARFFASWVLDIVSPGLLQMLLQNTDAEFGSGVAKLKFAPANGPDFFLPYGWKAAAVESQLKAAGKLKRLPPELVPFAEFPENPSAMGDTAWSGVCLFGRD
ncbi:MAG: class I SAM-dependent methyltransferase [Silvibacterium sp.]